MKLIGIGYKAGSGKDTFATMLEQWLVVPKMYIRPFAAPLKKGVAELFGWTSERMLDKDTVDPYFGCSPRQVLQYLGTDVFRKHDPDHWIRVFDKWLFQLPKDAVVIIPDVRFLNEADYIQKLGGKVIQIVRPNLTSTDSHSSEHEMEHFSCWDHIVYNDGSLEDLELKAQQLANEL